MNPGTLADVLDVDDCSWNGLLDVKASALAARLNTKEVRIDSIAYTLL